MEADAILLQAIFVKSLNLRSCYLLIDMWGTGFGSSGWRSWESLGFIIFVFIVLSEVILLGKLVEWEFL